MRNFKIFYSLIIAACLLSPVIAVAAEPLCEPLTPRQIAKNKRYEVEAAEYAIYAMLSNNAYGPNHSAIPLPLAWIERPEWRKEFTTGFGMAVFEKHENSELTEVVMAFRGTDETRDWIQNLVPFFRDQIPTADAEFSAVAKAYSENHVKIVATGHSLGGGLAFHISFLHPGIDAIAFNSSPVTKAGVKTITGNKRVSIWESGEGLQAPRNVVNVARLRWRGTLRREFRFLHGSPLKQHSIDKLAVNLARLGALSPGELELSTFLSARCGG